MLSSKRACLLRATVYIDVISDPPDDVGTHAMQRLGKQQPPGT